MRQRAHGALREGIDDLGLSAVGSMTRALALLEESADETDLDEQQIHAIGHAFTADLRDAHLWDAPENATHRIWLRQQAYVRTHCAMAAIGGGAWIADQIAGIASRQTQDRSEFRLHDTRPRHNDRWWHDVDLDYFLNDYEAGCGHGPLHAAAPQGTAAHSADETPGTANADMTGAEPIDDGAVPDAGARHTPARVGRAGPTSSHHHGGR